jgi:hypothetical protein
MSQRGKGRRGKGKYSSKRSRRTLKAKTRFAGEVATGKRKASPLPSKLPKKYGPIVEEPEPAGIVKIPLDEVAQMMKKES